MHYRNNLILSAFLLAACASSSNSITSSASSSFNVLSSSASSTGSSVSVTTSITSSSSESSSIASSVDENSSSSSSWLVYETYFSSLEGFTTAEISENFRNFGPVGQRWGITNGGIVEDGTVDGTQAIILQFNPTQTQAYTTLEMGFTVSNPGLLHFEAHSTLADIDVRLGYYFQDEFSIHWLSAFAMYEGTATYELNLDLIGHVRLYWMVLTPDPLPDDIVYITIDNIKIYPIIEEE